MKQVLPFIAVCLISGSVALPTARNGDVSYREQARGSVQSELNKRQDPPPVGDPNGSSDGVLIASYTGPDNSDGARANAFAAAGGSEAATNTATSGGNDWFPWMRTSSSSLWRKRWFRRSAQPEAAQSEVVGDTLVTDFTASGDSSPNPAGRNPALFTRPVASNSNPNITGYRDFSARARQRAKSLFGDLRVSDLIGRRHQVVKRQEDFTEAEGTIDVTAVRGGIRPGAKKPVARRPKEYLFDDSGLNLNILGRRSHLISSQHERREAQIPGQPPPTSDPNDHKVSWFHNIVTSLKQRREAQIPGQPPPSSDPNDHKVSWFHNIVTSLKQRREAQIPGQPPPPSDPNDHKVSWFHNIVTSLKQRRGARAEAEAQDSTGESSSLDFGLPPDTTTPQPPPCTGPEPGDPKVASMRTYSKNQNVNDMKGNNLSEDACVPLSGPIPNGGSTGPVIETQ